MKCPDCGHENRVGVLLCEKCHADLYDVLLEQVATKQLARTQSRDLRLQQSTSTRPVLLYVSQNETPVSVERRNSLIVGRNDSDDDLPTMVDLNQFGAQDFGVSRQHARLNTLTLPPVIVDLGSQNGTFVNGQRLTSDQPYQLESGDEIRLGQLVMHIYFK